MQEEIWLMDHIIQNNPPNLDEWVMQKLKRTINRNALDGSTGLLYGRVVSEIIDRRCLPGLKDVSMDNGTPHPFGPKTINLIGFTYDDETARWVKDKPRARKKEDEEEDDMEDDEETDPDEEIFEEEEGEEDEQESEKEEEEAEEEDEEEEEEEEDGEDGGGDEDGEDGDGDESEGSDQVEKPEEVSEEHEQDGVESAEESEEEEDEEGEVAEAVEVGDDEEMNEEHGEEGDQQQWFGFEPVLPEEMDKVGDGEERDEDANVEQTAVENEEVREKEHGGEGIEGSSEGEEGITQLAEDVLAMVIYQERGIGAENDEFNLNETVFASGGQEPVIAEELNDENVKDGGKTEEALHEDLSESGLDLLVNSIVAYERGKNGRDGEQADAVVDAGRTSQRQTHTEESSEGAEVQRNEASGEDIPENEAGRNERSEDAPTAAPVQQEHVPNSNFYLLMNTEIQAMRRDMTTMMEVLRGIQARVGIVVDAPSPSNPRSSNGGSQADQSS